MKVTLKQETLAEKVARAYAMDRMIKESTARLTELKAEITAELESQQAKREELPHPTEAGKYLRATYTSSSRITVDETGLAAHIGKRQFNKYTVRKLDKKLLDDAVSSGEVSQEDVQPYLTVTTSPGVRFFTIDPEEVEQDA